MYIHFEVCNCARLVTHEPKSNAVLFNINPLYVIKTCPHPSESKLSKLHLRYISYSRDLVRSHEYGTVVHIFFEGSTVSPSAYVESAHHKEPRIALQG